MNFCIYSWQTVKTGYYVIIDVITSRIYTQDMILKMQNGLTVWKTPYPEQIKKKKKLLRQKQKESLAKIGELTQKFSTLSEEKQESKINRCSINIQKQLDSFQKIEEQISEFKQEMKESSEIIIISRG